MCDAGLGGVQDDRVTRLSQVIDAAASSTTPLADLLRQVRIVASRASASELDAWAARELNGFSGEAVVPTYRGPFLAPAQGNWYSMVRYIENATLTHVGVPASFRDAWFMMTLRQPVAELESLAQGNGDPQFPWDPTAVALYDGYAQARKVSHPLDHHLVSASTLIPRGHILGMLDTLRTRVLELALDLERVSTEVGEPDGPTITNPAVAAAAQSFYINVYGDGAIIATGAYADLKSIVVRGDSASLRAAAVKLGLSGDDADEFIDAVAAEQAVDGPRTRTFLDRVRSGAITLAGGIAASGAADLLIELAKAFLGG